MYTYPIEYSDLYFVFVVRVKRSLIYDMKLRRIGSSRSMHEQFKHLAEDMKIECQ